MGTDAGSGVLRLGIVAGEASGDGLGAGLMEALRATGTDVEFIGIGGQAMRTAGLDCIRPAESLTMNGFVEPLRRLPELLRLRRTLLATFEGAHIHGFVGVDYNGFNLILERGLKRRGVPVTHYVSPAIYAWRPGRLRRFHRAMDQVLTLYPFEPALYRDSGVDAICVGHPLADLLADWPGTAAMRTALAVPARATPVVAVLAGSRPEELRRMGADFLAAAARVRRALPDSHILVAAVDASAADVIARQAAAIEGLERLQIVTGRSREVLAAADVALVKSGTGTLEAMLLGKPMVVAYRVGPVTWHVARHLLRTPYVALPNILAGEALVPELLQDAATPEALADALITQLARTAELAGRFRALARDLRRDASNRAAAAVLDLLARRGTFRPPAMPATPQ